VVIIVIALIPAMLNVFTEIKTERQKLSFEIDPIIFENRIITGNKKPRKIGSNTIK